MKKYLLLVAASILVSTISYAAEQINTISFNPSRLGLFQQLRVTDQLNSEGNVNVNQTYIQGDSIIGSTQTFDITTISAKLGTVNLPNTTIVQSGTMNVWGGKASFSNDSTINTLSTKPSGSSASNVWIKADTANNGTVTVLGTADSTVDFAGASKRGLVLGGNDIPVPDTTGCTGSGTLEWVERKAGSSVYKVLALTGCDAKYDETQTCEENPNQQKCCSTVTSSNGCKTWNGSSCVVKSCTNATLNTTTCVCEQTCAQNLKQEKCCDRSYFEGMDDYCPYWTGSECKWLNCAGGNNHGGGWGDDDDDDVSMDWVWENNECI